MEIADSILEVLYAWGRLLPRPLETKHMWRKRQWQMRRSQFNRGIRHLADRGLVKVIKIKDQKFVQITSLGQLEVLLSKAKQAVKQAWDGKWRLIIFDIPESSKDKRHLFRSLLRANGFYKLQASVYINPYPLNREAVDFLKKSGLIEYIRILRVDDLDDDKDLKKHFNLK